MDERARRFLDRKQVTDRSGLRPSTLYRAMKNGKFPRPYHIGALTEDAETEAGNCVRWLESDVDKWISDRIAENVRVRQVVLPNKKKKKGKTNDIAYL